MKLLFFFWINLLYTFIFLKKNFVSRLNRSAAIHILALEHKIWKNLFSSLLLISEIAGLRQYLLFMC